MNFNFKRIKIKKFKNNKILTGILEMNLHLSKIGKQKPKIRNTRTQLFYESLLTQIKKT